MDDNTPDIIEQIRQIAAETGLQGKWKPLCHELTALGITTPRGATFSTQNLRQFCDRCGLFKDQTVVTQERTPVTQERGEAEDSGIQRQAVLTQEGQSERTSDGASPVTQEKTHDSALAAFTDDTVNELLQMLDWWRERKDQSLSDEAPIQERPVFKRGADTTTKTIRIGKELFRDAERKAKKERALTGGTFSGLVELLLWKHLGFDPKYLTRDDT